MQREPAFAVERLRALVTFASSLNESFNMRFDLVGLVMLHHFCAYTRAGYSDVNEDPAQWTREEWATFDRWLLSEDARTVRARLFPPEE